MMVGLLVVMPVACTSSSAPDNVPTTPPPPAPGISAPLDSSRAVRGQYLEFSVYTYGPGDAVFERFGHIALAMHDRLTGEDIAFNWGMFDFEQPHFYQRFLTGDTRYWMAGYGTELFNGVYQRDNRTIRKQVLNLTPVQRGALFDFLSWNAQEANRYYRYDYYNDNCSTRVRDILDWALSGALRTKLEEKTTSRTWREETARIVAGELPVFAGIEVALGRNADKPLNGWAEAFLPDRLADDLRLIQLNGSELIAMDTVLFTAVREPMPQDAPSHKWSALLIGVVIAAIILALAQTKTFEQVITFAGLLWYGSAGIVGTALLLAGTVTKHAPYMGSNMSVLLFNPLVLVTAVCWPWRAKMSRIGRAAQTLSVLVASFAVIALVLVLLPIFSQKSMMVFAVAVPIHLAFALSLRSRFGVHNTAGER